MINVLRKQVIIGTLRGRVLLYSIVTAQFMCQVWIFCELSLPSYSCERALQVDAHARAVTSISVAPESAYVLSSGEDCRFVVYKLHTRKPHPYEVWLISSDCQFFPNMGKEREREEIAHLKGKYSILEPLYSFLRTK